MFIFCISTEDASTKSCARQFGFTIGSKCNHTHRTKYQERALIYLIEHQNFVIYRCTQDMPGGPAE